MKYIISLIILSGVLLFRPWNINRNQADMMETTEERPMEDTLIPIHDIIHNYYSDLSETKRLDATIERFMNQWEIKGASLAIMKDGKLIYSKGYGYADEESQTKVDVSHIFRIASISKLITATGIMKLVESDKLSLEDKVFGENGILNDTVYQAIRDKRVKEITVEQLLRHKGGFSLRYGDPMFHPVEIAKKMGVPPPADLNTIIRFVLSKRLGFRPGTSTCYSNVGYGILSKVIEKISGQSYEKYIQDSILIPAGCFDMHLGNNLCERRYPNEVKYYEPTNAELVRACDGRDTLVLRSNGGNNIEELYGAGGWVASPTELLRFLSAIDGNDNYPDVLTPESVKTMTANIYNALPIGWMNTNSRGDWWRSGTLAGTSAMMKHQKDGFSWVFITNTSSWTGSKFPNKIERMMHQALNRVKSWPERDLFDPEYCKTIENSQELLANEPAHEPLSSKNSLSTQRLQGKSLSF